MENLKTLHRKIVEKEDLSFILNRWRLKDESVVFTNGCFDIIHQGHIDYLSKAKDLGTKLIVGVNNDLSVKSLDKGIERPLQDEKSRAMIIAALSFVDLVVVFAESTPYHLIDLIKPDTLVKGADYEINEIVGSDIVLKHGGQVKRIPFLDGYSTSNIVNKIKR